MTEPSGRRGSGQFYRDTIKISNPSPSQAANNNCFLIYRDDGAPFNERADAGYELHTRSCQKKEKTNTNQVRQEHYTFLSRLFRISSKQS